MCSTRICQGVFGKFIQYPSIPCNSSTKCITTNPFLSQRPAINKPKSISSAQVLREIQTVFNPSNLFAPWIETESAERARNSRNDPKQRRRRFKKVQVKIGHGGTLDPMATGVLIVGVGKGTKHLQSFLECSKAYEATVLFGAETDTYDILGKVLARAPYEHITEEVVRDALKDFRGKIMQMPPIYSALRIQGKRLYEYAREGKELPMLIKKRPVEVQELEIVKWMGVDHAYKWPREECGPEEKMIARKVIHLSEAATTDQPAPLKEEDGSGGNGKRPRDMDDELVSDEPNYKRRASDPQHGMSGALSSPGEDLTRTVPAADESLPSASEPKIDKPLSIDELSTQPVSPSEIHTSESRADAPPMKSEPRTEPDATESIPAKPDSEGPLAVKLHMTVTSGFYVRSLSHDLGKRVASLGAMCELVRTRQGQFTLGKNVLEYEDLAKGEEVWAPKVVEMLENWERSLEAGGSKLGEDE